MSKGKIFLVLALLVLLVAFQEKKSAQITRKLDEGHFLIDKGKADGVTEGDKLKVMDKSGELKAMLKIEKIEDYATTAKVIEDTVVSSVEVGDTVEIKSTGGAKAEPKPDEKKPDEKKPEEKKEPEKKAAPDKSAVDKELQSKIDKTVKKGVDWLLKQQNKDTGSFDDSSMFGAKKSATGKPYTHGPTVISIFALVKSGVSPEDPAIQKALTLIKSKPPILTAPKPNENVYTLSFLVLALDAIIEKLDEAEKDNPKKKPGAKNPKSKEYLGWMQTLCNNLSASATRYQGELPSDKKGKKTSSSRGAPVSCMAWVHADEKKQWEWDNSCSQIVVLALAAGSRNGIKIPKETWMDIANHWLCVQQKEGSDVPRYITDIDTGDIIESDQHDNARGWGYMTKAMANKFQKTLDQISKNPLVGGEGGGSSDDITFVAEPYSSMTAAGVCSLLICHSELKDDKTYKKNLSNLVEKGIRDGIASYNEMFPIKTDEKGKSKKNSNKWETSIFYYSLYSLERIGVMAKLKNVGKHFWYREGAEELISDQKSDYWGDKGGTKFSDKFEPTSDAITDTCFALLFLKKATFEVPVETFQQEGHKTEAMPAGKK